MSLITREFNQQANLLRQVVCQESVYLVSGIIWSVFRTTVVIGKSIISTYSRISYHALNSQELDITTTIMYSITVVVSRREKKTVLLVHPYWRIFRCCLCQPIREEQFLGRLAFWVVQRLERFQCAAWPIIVHQVTRADCISACLHAVVCHFL